MAKPSKLDTLRQQEQKLVGKINDELKGLLECVSENVLAEKALDIIQRIYGLRFLLAENLQKQQNQNRISGRREGLLRK